MPKAGRHWANWPSRTPATVSSTAAVMSSVNRKNLDPVLLAVMKGSEQTRCHRLPWSRLCFGWPMP